MQGLQNITGKSTLPKIWGYLLVFIVGLNAQIADFSAEKLTFTVNAKYVEMAGSYFFSNRTGKVARLPIVYPFCVNDRQAFPDSIAVCLANGQPLPFQRKNDNVLFPVPLDEKGRTEVVIYFRQIISQPQFEYILTSTRSWQKPLESADFTIRMPLSQNLTGLTFPYERVDTTGNFQVYHLHFENFYPEKNLIFSW